MLIDANIIMMTSRIWETRAKVTNILVMERSVMLTMGVLMHVNYWGSQSQGDQQHRRGMLTLPIDVNNIMMTTPI